MDISPDSSFNHEKLEVYRESLDFIAWLSMVLDANP